MSELVVCDKQDLVSIADSLRAGGVSGQFSLPYGFVSAIDDISQSDWNANEGEPGHILNRTHWVEQGEMVEILPETAIEFDEDGMAFIDTVLPLVGGNTYTVNWNGTEYTCAAQDGSEIVGVEAIVMGNLAISGMPDTGEPFAISCAYIIGGTQIIAYGMASTTLNISISGNEEIIHKLDPKFLPDDVGGVNVSGAAPGQLIRVKEVDAEGKPSAWEPVPWGYTEGGLVEILPETETVYDGDDGVFVINAVIPAEVGKKYVVKWNGVEYTATAIDGATLDMMPCPIIINDGANMDTGEGVVFAIFCGGNDGNGYFAMAVDGSTSVTLSVSGSSEVIHPIPGKFLPDGVPYVGEDGLTDTLTFDGNLDGKKYVQVGEGAYYVNLSENYVEPSAFIGGSFTYVDLCGEFGGGGTQNVEEEMIGDMTEEVGFPAYNFGEYALVSSECLDLGGVLLPKGVNVLYLPNQFYISKVKANSAVFVGGAVVHKLDNKFLDLDWLPVTENGFTIIEKQHIDSGSVISLGDYTFENGQIVVVEVDGVRYECTVEINDGIFIGNKIAIGGSNTGEPFAIAGYTRIQVYFIDEGSHYFAIYDMNQSGTIYNKLPNEFLPSHTHELATDSKPGFFSAEDKEKLDTIEAHAKPHPDYFRYIHFRDGNYNQQVLFSPSYAGASLYIDFSENFKLTSNGNDRASIDILSPGKKVEGNEFTIDGEIVVAGEGAEIFNHYERNTATGDYSHAEGFITTATGDYSHAEGCKTIATGQDSHAEGYETIASGYASHAEGWGTIASGPEQHVQGRFNVEDTENKYVHIVGGGDGSERRNIHTVDWYGNAWYSGSVTVGRGIIIPSSTEGSTKKFMLTVDDSGTISATEVI